MLIAAALVAPAAARAAAPTGLTVTETDYQLIAGWSLPAGMASDSIEISEHADG